MLFLASRWLAYACPRRVRTSVGRVTWWRKAQAPSYVMELTYGGTAEEALAQIDSKGYCVPWEADGRRVVKVGASFDPEQRNGAEGWIVQEA